MGLLTKEQITDKLDSHGALLTEGKASIQLLGLETGDIAIDTYCVFVVIVQGVPTECYLDEDAAIDQYIRCR